MDSQRFDDLTKTLASGASRRRVLKGLAGGAAAALAGALGLRRAAAQTCSGFGRVCASTGCCTTPGATCFCYSNGQCRCRCPEGGAFVNGQCVCTATGEAPCGTACCPAGSFCLDQTAGTCQSIGAGCLTYSLFGDAAPVAGGALIRSDADPGFGGVDFNLPGPVAFDDISQLQTAYTFEGDDSCAAGSPRFQLNTDDPTTVDGSNVFVYVGPSPSFTGCPGGTPQDTGNLIGNNDACRYDTSQIQAGTQCNTYAGTLALLNTLGLSITGIQLVVDSGFAFMDGEQAVTVDPCVQVTSGA